MRSMYRETSGMRAYFSSATNKVDLLRIHIFMLSFLLRAYSWLLKVGGGTSAGHLERRYSLAEGLPDSTASCHGRVHVHRIPGRAVLYVLIVL